ncbi:HET-domain-containing protein [Cadophora sp. DSE1049]|nr:HET-domain-containing protein [Cadophora sp. DSE1049]
MINYLPLHDAGEIRLIELLPDRFDNEIRISLSHVVLPPTPPERMIDIQGLQRTLPPDWEVLQTAEGRAIYVHGRDTSWTHPDPNFKYVEEDWDPAADFGNLSFEALSYCWGPVQPQETILCASGSLSVRSNLASALRYLRYQDRPRIIWIDAICIDQSNPDERSVQVARMGSIYALAERVVVWLGLPTEDSALALRELETMGKQIEMAQGTRQSPECTHPEWETMCPDTKTVKSFLARPWFQRLWIWQEITLAKQAQVQCGHATTSWYYLRRGLIVLLECNAPDARKHELMPGPLRHLPYNTTRKAGSTLWNGMPSLLQETAKCLYTDPRDAIYALSSLVSDELSKKIIPNYRLSAGQVFQDFMLLFIQDFRSTVLLELCELEARRIEAPTWVPDFSNLVPSSTTPCFAAGKTLPEANMISGALRVLGVQVGQVAAVSNVKSGGIPESVTKGFTLIKTWYEFGAKKVPSEIYPEAFFTVLFRGWIQERRVDKINSNVIGLYDDYLRLDDVDSVDFEETASRSQLMHHFMKDERHHSFFFAGKDHVGLGPLGTRTGDVLAIVFGCHLPLVLRKCHEGFQVVGPAYVYGLSEAQVLLGTVPHPWVAKMDSRNSLEYLNNDTGKVSHEDPRLGPLPNGCEEVAPGRFRFAGAVEIIEEDPRWTAESLKERGVSLETFYLV